MKKTKAVDCQKKGQNKVLSQLSDDLNWNKSGYSITVWCKSNRSP